MSNEAQPLGWSELFKDQFLGTDSLHVFFATAQLVAAEASVIVEVGCGRGAMVEETRGRKWMDFRGPGRTVIGIDVDPVGVDNPVVDEFRMIGEDGRWPLDDGSVDLAVSDFVLEHVTDPAAFVSELTRVLRPGGAFVARTVSRHSLLSMAARAVPNRRHSQVLTTFQPGRAAQDVFHTAYKMNTRKDLAALFDADYEWGAASRTGLDRYLLRWPKLGATAVAVERRLPRSMQAGLIVSARKKTGATTTS